MEIKLRKFRRTETNCFELNKEKKNNKRINTVQIIVK